MKVSTFKWGWQDYEPQNDPSMTRERAARLLRAWRRAKIQGRPVFSLRRYRRGNLKIYQVATTQYANQDRAVMVIPFAD